MGTFMRGDQSPVVAASAAPVIQPPARPPGTRSAKAAPYKELRTITASAERIEINGLGVPVRRPFSAWQAQAWAGYEQIGEVHYGFNMLANLLSRIRVYAGVIGEANEAPVEALAAAKKGQVSHEAAAAAKEAVDDLLAIDASGMTRSFSLNLSVPGECYLIHMPLKNNTKQWTIRSVDEVLVTATGVKLVPMRGQSQEITDLPKDTFIARIWRQNPRYSREPDSSMVGVSGSIKTLLLIDRMTDGAIRSRLNAGVLFVPDGISGGISAVHGAEPPLEETGSTIEDLQKQTVNDPSGVFMAELMETMSAPVVDESSAAALVPMLVQGPSDQGEKIRHITFARPSDEWLVKQADSKLERILNGIDIPKEIVTGLQQVKYSNAVVIDENLYKSNIEPLALAWVDALTTVFLHAVLRAKNVSEDEIRQIVVWYDPSDIVTRPNSAQSANDGMDRGLLSPKAWRREHGFAESDAPSELDLIWKMMANVARLPENVLQAMAERVFGNVLDIKGIPVRGIPPTWGPEAQAQADAQKAQSGPPNLKAVPDKAQGEQDPQRVAIQQVGQR